MRTTLWLTSALVMCEFSVCFFSFVLAQHCSGVGRRWRFVKNDQGKVCFFEALELFKKETLSIPLSSC